MVSLDWRYDFIALEYSLSSTLIAWCNPAEVMRIWSNLVSQTSSCPLQFLIDLDKISFASATSITMICLLPRIEGCGNWPVWSVATSPEMLIVEIYAQFVQV